MLINIEIVAMGSPQLNSIKGQIQGVKEQLGQDVAKTYGNYITEKVLACIRAA